MGEVEDVEFAALLQCSSGLESGKLKALKRPFTSAAKDSDDNKTSIWQEAVPTNRTSNQLVEMGDSIRNQLKLMGTSGKGWSNRGPLYFEDHQKLTQPTTIQASRQKIVIAALQASKGCLKAITAVSYCSKEFSSTRA